MLETKAQAVEDERHAVTEHEYDNNVDKYKEYLLVHNKEDLSYYDKNYAIERYNLAHGIKPKVKEILSNEQKLQNILSIIDSALKDASNSNLRNVLRDIRKIIES